MNFLKGGEGVCGPNVKMMIFLHTNLLFKLVNCWSLASGCLPYKTVCQIYQWPKLRGCDFNYAYNRSSYGLYVINLTHCCSTQFKTHFLFFVIATRCNCVKTTRGTWINNVSWKQYMSQRSFISCMQ